VMRRIILFVAVAVVMSAMLLAMALPAFADDAGPAQPPPPGTIECKTEGVKDVQGTPPPQANNQQACAARGFVLV
jgi:hypothetical protein